MVKSETSRAIGLAGDVALILAFCCVPIGAAHGVGLLGLFLLGGSPNTWSNPISIGRLGIALVLASMLIPKRCVYLSLELAGLSMIVVAWLLIVFDGEIAIITLIFSIPFLLVLAARLVYFRLQLQRPPTS